MHYNVNVDHGGKPNIDADANTDDFRTYLRDGIVMQSTGLTDKNGKEIFEGGILDWFILRHVHSDVSWNEERCGFVLLSQIKSDTGCVSPYLLLQSRTAQQSEIIGNIYENPDLLPKVA